MSHCIRHILPGVSLAALCAAFAGCSTRTDVSATGNAPPQYTHVYITVQAIWFNTSATARPDDTTWAKFALSAPVTVDLVQNSSGALGQITTALRLAPGTYSRVLLIPVDNSTTVADSASKVGARFNNEADYVDSDGTAHQVPLDLPNPDKGIGTQTTLKIPLDNGGTSNPTTVTIALAIDGTRDLAMFTYATLPGVMLSSHAAAAYDVSNAGSIAGTLTLTNLPTKTITHPSGRLNIQVSAEALSADGLRHTVVGSAPVLSDGTFKLYPLPVNTTSGKTTYDVVIHGPALATIIIKNVQVNSGTSNAVSIGTVNPRAANPFPVNIAPTAAATLPAGALVGFYQTLPASGEVPYVVEQSAIDPFNRTLAVDVTVSDGPIDSGTWSTSGSTITLTASTPTEGAKTYRVSATAPLFADGSLATTVAAPASGTTKPVRVTVPTLAVASGATSAAISATLTQVTAGKYDKGELIVTHDGAVINATPLDTALSTDGTVTIGGLPGGTTSTAFAPGVYYLSVFTWSSSSPSRTVHRQSYSSPVDLSRGSLTGVQLSID